MPNASNKSVAIELLQLAAAGRAAEAFAKYAREDFRHHNPHFRGDGASLATAMDENAAKNPGKSLRVHHAVEEDGIVAVFSEIHHTPGDRGAAVVHIFRFEDGRVAELWDVGQEVPEKTANEHGMF